MLEGADFVPRPLPVKQPAIERRIVFSRDPKGIDCSIRRGQFQLAASFYGCGLSERCQRSPEFLPNFGMLVVKAHKGGSLNSA